MSGGATLVMQGLQRFWSPLNQFCLDLEADLDHAVQANAYLSPPAAAGLSRHADEHDVLVLQVSGQKRWDVEGIGDVHLTAGDVVYLPAGTRHAAHTASVSSLHITIGIFPTVVRDVLRRAIDTLDDPRSTGHSRIGYTRPEEAEHLSAQIGAALAATSRQLAAADPHELAAREITRRSRRARRRWTGRLAAVVEPAAIDDTTVVRQRRGFELDADGERIVLTTPDRRLSLPAATMGALRCLAVPTTIEVGALPDLDEAERVVLVRRLVREGVVEIITS